MEVLTLRVYDVLELSLLFSPLLGGAGTSAGDLSAPVLVFVSVRPLAPVGREGGVGGMGVG